MIDSDEAPSRSDPMLTKVQDLEEIAAKLLETARRQLFVGLTVALAAWFTANSAYAQNVHSWVSQSTGMRSLGLRPPLLVAVTSAIPEITFSGTFSGTLVGARSGAGAGAGV
jgi:hypothetical protein